LASPLRYLNPGNTAGLLLYHLRSLAALRKHSFSPRSHL